VRSSGLVEDLPDQSWAGQYESVLNVRTPAELWAAIDTCVASASGVRASTYGRDVGTAASSVAVLVQRQVPAEAAGVAFTANPVTGDDEVLVSAVEGLGDCLVHGEVTPEDWVRRPGGAPERTGGPEPVLTTEEVARIADEAVRLACAIGAPADVEWALAGGELHVLQARPITSLPLEPELELPTEGTWEKDASHCTDPMTPIGATLYFQPLDAAITAMANTWGLLIDGAETRCLGGEMYTRIIPPGGKDGPAPPWWMMGLLLRVVPPLRAKLRTARAALAADLPRKTLERWPAELRPDLERRIAALRAVDLTALDDAGLRAHLDRILALCTDGQRIHFLLFIPYLMGLRDLATAVNELLGWEETEALELVGGLSGTSSAPARDLRAIAGMAQRDPAVRDRLRAWSGEPLDEVLATLRALGGHDVARGIEDHVDRFGCRVTGYDPGQPSMAERPDLLLGIVRDLVREGASPGELESALARRRAEADARLAAAMDGRGLGPSDRERLHSAVAHAREVWPVREENLFYTDSMPSGILRLAILEVGRRLVERGALHRPDDACWLEGDEVFTVLEGRGGDLGSVTARVARRRAERAWVAAHPGPIILGRPASPPPDLRAAPEAVRRTTGAILWAISHEYPGERQATGEGSAIRGTAGAPGRYTGTVRIVMSDNDFPSVQAGEVLVCPITTPVWSVLFGRVGALVTDAGGALSHAAVVAREHNVPAVLGTVDATRRLRNGQVVTVDGTAGTVEVHDSQAEEIDPPVGLPDA
jgi:pyruvate,water dikinase